MREAMSVYAFLGNALGVNEQQVVLAATADDTDAARLELFGQPGGVVNDALL
jgi:hypothetical protein